MRSRPQALTRALRQVCTGIGLAGALVTPARAGSPVLELSALNGGNGFSINGITAGDRTGYAVSGVGDVNGDGVDDILLGAPFVPVGGTATGVAYLVYGRSQGFPTPLELSTLNAATGVRLTGVSAHDGTGRTVSGAGDINGDGLADLLIGADLADPHGTYSGAAYLVFGRSDFGAALDLATLNGSNGLVLRGAASGHYAGRALAGVGDVNGDGLDDFSVGAPYAQNTGLAYVIYGRRSGFPAVLELSALDSSSGFTLSGVAADDFMGRAVSGAGDVNGDGLADLLLGANKADTEGDLSGAAYVVFGRQDGFGAVLALGSLDGTTGFRLDGVMAGDRAGFAVSGTGDVNGDGLDDLLIGAPVAEADRAGAVYIVFGRTSGFGAVFDLSTLNGSNGVALSGGAALDRAGRSVSGIGDVNGDGLADVLIGALFADPHGSYSGAAYVVYGRSSFSPRLELSALDGTNGVILPGPTAGSFTGRAVSRAGDINGDGAPDLLIGASEASPNGLYSGAAYVVYGTKAPIMADVSLSKTAAATAEPGVNLAYTLSVTNHGPAVAQNLSVSDPLPAGSSFISATGSNWTCAEASGTVSCSYAGTLGLGTAPSITLTVQTPVTGGTLNNSATVSSLNDPNAANNSASVQTVVNSTADVSLSKTAAAMAEPGVNLAYTLSVTNHGPAVAQNLSVSDPLPTGSSFISATGNNWTCAEASGTVSCSYVGTLGLGTAPPITLTVQTPVTGGTLNNTATVSSQNDPTSSNDSASVQTVVNRTADVSLSKTAAATAEPGVNLAYTLNVTNHGPAVAQNLSVSDPLPTGSSFISATGSNWTCAEASGTVSCSYVGTLGLGTAPPITLTVQTPVTGGTLNNTATVSSQNDPTSSNNSASVQTVVNSTADVSLSKTAAATAEPGVNLAYTLNVTNHGPAVAQNLSVSDPLPAGTSFINATGSNWTCTETSGTVSCSYAGTLGLGTAHPITLTVQTPVTGGTLNNTATVSSQNDPTSSNNSASVQTVVNSAADVSLSKTAAATAEPGVNLAYTLSVTNHGPAVAQNLSVSDPLPTGSSFISATGSNWTCAEASGTVSCSYAGTLGLGTAPPITLTVQTPVTGGTLNNSATVSSQNDPTSSNNSASVQTVVSTAADLGISTTGPTVAAPGTVLSYTLHVTNAGPALAQAVSVQDTLPTGTALLSVSGTGWQCTSAAGTVTCTHPDPLAVGVAPAVTLRLQAPASAGQLSQTSTVHSLNDPNAANNSAQMQTTLTSAIFTDNFEGQ